MITSMFALSTLHWILSLVFTFIIVDLVNNELKACYGSNNPYVCLARQLAAVHGPTGSWVSMFNDVLLINVSTVRSLYPHIIRRHFPWTDPSPGILI
jgi:hypothetical protein